MPKVVDKYRFFQLLIEQFGEGAVIDRPTLITWYDSDIAHDPMMPHHVTFSGDQQFRAGRGMYKVPDRAFLDRLMKGEGVKASAPRTETPKPETVRPTPAPPVPVMSASTLMDILKDDPADKNRSIDVEAIDSPDDLIQYLPMMKRLKLREMFRK